MGSGWLLPALHPSTGGRKGALPLILYSQPHSGGAGGATVAPGRAGALPEASRRGTASGFPPSAAGHSHPELLRRRGQWLRWLSGELSPSPRAVLNSPIE